MFTFILLAIIIIAVASTIFRLIFWPILNPYRIRRPYFGPYGYYSYGRGYRRGLFPRGLLAILLFAAFERFFGRRW
jgi:hypothetical protein